MSASCSSGVECTIKRQTTDTHAVENDTTGPNIDSAAIIAFAGDDLGRAVGGRAADCLEELAGHHVVAQTEVGELHVQFVFKPARAALLLVGGITHGIHMWLSARKFCQ